MKNIADQLPPDIARQLHPDRRKNESDYWVICSSSLASLLVIGLLARSPNEADI